MNFIDLINFVEFGLIGLNQMNCLYLNEYSGS